MHDGGKTSSVTDEMENRIKEVLPGDVDLVRNTRMEQTKIYSPFNANNASNMGEVLNQEAPRRLAFAHGAPQNLKPMESSGWTAATTVDTCSSTPFLQTMWPTGSAGVSKGSLSQTSKIAVPQQQKQYLHRSIKVSESSSSQEWTCANQRRNLHNGPNIQQIPQKNFQNASQQMQLQKNMCAQESVQSNPQGAGFFHFPHDVVVDQSTNKEQSGSTFSDLESPLMLENLNWQTQAYQENINIYYMASTMVVKALDKILNDDNEHLLYLRETYLGELIKRCNSAQKMYQKTFNAEDIQKLEKMRTLFRNMMMFLRMSKADFVKHHKVVFDAQLKAFKWYMNKIRSSRPPTQHHQGVQQPCSPLSTLQVLHRGDENSQVNLTRQYSTSTHGSEGHLLTNQGPLTDMQGRDSLVSCLTRCKPSSALVMRQQANMSIPRQIGSQSELQQRFSSSRLQNPSQVNSSAMDVESAMSSPPNTTASSSPSFMEQERRKNSLQQPAVYKYMQKLLTEKSSEMNELKFLNMTSNQQIPQPNNLVGHHIEHFPSLLSPLSTSQQHVDSPQVSEQASTSTDTKDWFSLHRETNLKESSQKSHLEEQGLKCLIEKAQSTSPKALCDSTRDMGELIQKMDRIPETMDNTEPWDFNAQDLEQDMRSSAPESNFKSCPGAALGKRMKRDITLPLDLRSPPSSGSNGFPCLSGQTSGTGTSATFYTKANFAWYDLLLQEIKKINDKLIETVLEVIGDSTDARPRSGEGTIVKFSYRAINHNSVNLPLQVLVTADYPYSSPLILEASPNENEIELWDKAKSNFSLSLRECSVPLSLGEMAKRWDISARHAFCELAVRFGGGSLFSKYGSWEHCAAS